jgi:hypothetical protein
MHTVTYKAKLQVNLASAHRCLAVGASTLSPETTSRCLPVIVTFVMACMGIITCATTSGHSLGGVDLQDLVMREVILPHALIRGITLFLWVVGPRRQRLIRGTQNEVYRDLTIPKKGFDS